MGSVVMVHVLTRSFGLSATDTGLAVIRATFTLPLFFFVSGFFAFRPLADFTRGRVRRSLTTRLFALLLGTMVFDTLFYCINRGPDPFVWINGDFDAYWYTFSLLQIYVYFLLIVGISRLCRSRRLFWSLMTLTVIGLYIASCFIKPTEWHYFWWLNPKTAQYFQFFALGCAVRNWQSPFFRFLERPWMLTLLIVVYTLSTLFHYFNGKDILDYSQILWHLNFDVLARYSGLLLVLRIFYCHREAFDADTRLMRAWRLIGRRTLDIYFLHYLLLPKMRWVGPYLAHGNTLILELGASLIVALFVIALCLALSKLLRAAPLLRLLLGEKVDIYKHI